MAALETPQLNLGWQATEFNLMATDGQFYDLSKAKGENGLLIMFISNHCPYVKAILDKIIRDTQELKEYGINALAIMSNDTENYPEDSFDNMKKIAQEKHFPFPYVIDQTQMIARQYGAVCTPDFFGFDKDLKLKYRGRLDKAKRETSGNFERELFNAMVEIARTKECTTPQLPSIGCSIKWKE